MNSAATSSAGGVLSLRAATRDDATLLFGWANDAATRAASLSTGPIAWVQHVAWLEDRIESPDSAIYIVSDERAPVGQVRFDALDGDSARISVVVAPTSRGLGLAASLIDAGVARYFTDERRHIVVAEIRTSNQRSTAAFVRAGFVEEAAMVAPDGEPVRRFARTR